MSACLFCDHAASTGEKWICYCPLPYWLATSREIKTRGHVIKGDGPDECPAQTSTPDPRGEYE
jgi:hypothetical protein